MWNLKCADGGFRVSEDDLLVISVFFNCEEIGKFVSESFSSDPAAME